MVADDSDIFIDIRDFESVVIHVSLNNLTSKTSISKKQRTFGAVSDISTKANLEVLLMEFLDSGFRLDAPEKSGAIGHTLQLSIEVEGASLPFEFQVTGKITNITSLGEGRDRIEIEFMEYDDRYVNALKNIFSARQEQIDNFFQAAKG